MKTMPRPDAVACAALLLSCLTIPVVADGEIDHPFLLWTKEEAAAIRKRLETDPLAKQQYERMQFMESKDIRKQLRGACPNTAMLNMFKFAVLGDREAGEKEKRALLGFIDRKAWTNKPGNPATSNAAWRDDRTLDAWRYDVLYELLNEKERAGVERTIRYWVDWLIKNPGPATRPGRYRVGWLPNMQWPTAAGVLNLAVVSRDEELIKTAFETPGGWKWFFDRYLGDGGFYMEEFGKYYSNIGAMLMWCEGLDRLGLSKYGWGYTSPDGANMFNFLRMLMWAGYPRVTRGENMPDYPTVNMGDAGPLYVVNGRNADGLGGNLWWRKSNMNGPIPKMYQPLWWEIGHRRWPNQGFDYFLAQMRAPGEEIYLPSLYFGAEPIKPGKQIPPPVRSYVAYDRAFAMLRMETGPAYWESPKPALALQFAMYHMHYVHDCFCILQYVADNRFIYNKQGGMIRGYAGSDPWRDHPRGQGSGVTVDARQIQPVDSGEEGCNYERIRHWFSDKAKFVAVRAKPYKEDRKGEITERALWPGIDAERALVLTDHYLFDLYHLKNDPSTKGARVSYVTPANHVVVTGDESSAADGPRIFDWHVQGRGRVMGADAEPWIGSTDLANGTLWDPRLTTKRGRDVPDPTNVRSRIVGDAAWTEIIRQRGGSPEGAGVRVRMLPAPNTTLYTFTPPSCSPEHSYQLMARRTDTETQFVALHEPFGGRLGSQKVEKFERIAQTDSAIAVAIVGRPGSGINDRVLLRFGDDHDKPITIAGEYESFSFRDCVHIRVGKRIVEADGPLLGMHLCVNGSPKLVINGQDTPRTVKRGVLQIAPLD